MNAVVWLLVGLSGLFLGLRIYCKFMKSRGLWWDDYLLIASWLSLVLDGIMVSIQVTLGFGRHVFDVDPSHFPLIQIYGNVAFSAAVLATVWSKTSFGITLLRITEGKMKPVIWFILVSMNTAMHLHALFPWIQCSPISKGWFRDIPGTCWSPEVSVIYGVFASTYSGSVDIVLALLPWSIVWNLQMRKKEKVGVAVAMSMGVFAGCTAFIKSAKLPLLANGDFTFESYSLVAWGAAEVATTIMASSIPVLRVLVREVKAITSKKYGFSSGNNSRSNGTNSLGRSDTVIVGGNGHKKSPSVHVLSTFKGSKSDNRSDTSVLITEPAEGIIIQTQEINIEYHRRDGRSEVDSMV